MTELNIKNGEGDALVPDPVVWTEFGVCSMTGLRWTNDPEMGFPQPIKIRGRNYRSRKALEAFKKKLLTQARPIVTGRQRRERVRLQRAG